MNYYRHHLSLLGNLLLLFLLPGIFALGEEQPDFTFSGIGKKTGFLPEGSKIKGHGAAWGDVNGDGWPSEIK